MKKLLTIILLGLLVMFTGCENTETSYDPASAEDLDVAKIVGLKVTTEAYAAFKALSPTATGISRETISSTDVYKDGTVYVSGSKTGSEASYSATVTITFNDYMTLSDNTILDGTITYTITGSDSTYTATITGALDITYAGTDMDITYAGTDYDMEYDISISYTSTAIFIKGYIIINDTQATLNYSAN